MTEEEMEKIAEMISNRIFNRNIEASDLKLDNDLIPKLFESEKCEIHFCKSLDIPTAFDNLFAANLADVCLTNVALASPGSLIKINISDVIPPISKPIIIESVETLTPPPASA